MTINLILEKTDQVTFFTDMKEVFSAMNISCSDYDWLISDLETNGYPITEGWHTDTALSRSLQQQNIQFIWAVFSAFPLGTRFEVNNPPTVEDNPNYWNSSNPTPQLDEALFEIACWDSSATILIGLSPAMAKSFRSTYTDTIELKHAAR